MKKRKISQPLMLAIQKTKEAYDAFKKLDEDDKYVGCDAYTSPLDLLHRALRLINDATGVFENGW